MQVDQDKEEEKQEVKDQDVDDEMTDETKRHDEPWQSEKIAMRMICVHNKDNYTKKKVRIQL